ncbi:LysR family transcriptional regulator [Phytoactinopolyspora mesophila]|uniref:LysR family transcriptional regulator n=1 Tax=Phytoactinopolyspora mesophila TaxID=2650750 RepID=A0A7K3LZS1_9ACTN|nr:LysR family transcriptional regulator [Phytoactinopolyspora mesophila]NDL56535.1 LysR family transcriptional regulator [Phytoactinopolyspora mesophila]
MELRQLRYVVAVAEEANFTRAAARCFVVQSALSHQIKALEKELGVALFARTSRRVELTAAGEAFLPAARASLEAAERAAADAAAATGQLRGQLSVGVIPTVTAVDVPAALGVFRRLHPAVRIALRVAGSDALEAALAEGSIDVCLLGLPENRHPRGVASRLLVTDRHVAVLSREHPLAENSQLQLQDLAQEKFADFPAGTPGRAQSDLAFTTAGVHRDVAFEAMAADLMVGLVRHNLAVTLLPSRYAPTDPALVAIPITDGPSRAEYLAWSDFNPSAAARAFLDTIE